MKKITLLLLILLNLHIIKTFAQCGNTLTKTKQPTSIGLVIYSSDIETVWNALRLANFSKSEGDSVSIFLLGKGVELDSLVTKNTDLKEQVDEFTNNGGIILGCGTCLAKRKINEPQVCKFSSMADLYELVKKNKIVLTF
jgi:hypothetical protein